jgi:hypothetical protein
MELVLGRRKRLPMAQFIFPRTQEVFAKVTNTFFYQVLQAFIKHKQLGRSAHDTDNPINA